MKIGILIGSRWLDLSPSTVVSFEFNSPAYLGDDTDVVSGSFSFPIDVPLSPSNRAVLGWPERIDSRRAFLRNIEAEVWAEGLMLFPALATLDEGRAGFARLKLLVSSVSRLKDTSLAAVDFGGPIEFSPVLAGNFGAKTSALAPLDHDFTFFPVWNPAFRDGIDGDASADEWQNHFDPATGHFTAAPNHAATPFLRLDFVLKKVLAQGGFTLENDWQTTDELRLLTVFNQFSIADEATGVWSTAFDPKNHVPKTSCADWLKKVCRLFNLGLFVNYFDKTARLVPLKKLLDAPPVRDWTSRLAADFSVAQDENTPTAFRFKDLYGELFADGQNASEIVAAECNDISTITFGGSEAYFLEVPTQLVFLWKDNGGSPTWELLGRVMHEVVLSEKQPFESSLTTGWMLGSNYSTENFTPVPMRFPQVRAAGSFAPGTRNECPEKLFFYRGFQSFISSQPYPQGDSMDISFAKTPLNVLGQPVQYSLMWTGERGVFNRWWKDWAAMLAEKREVTARLRLTVRDLVGFSFEEKITIQNQHFFVKKMRFSIGSTGLKMTEAQLVSVN